MAPTDPLPDTTRQRLLEAAELVFAEHGFAGTSVRDICEKADANVAAVNYHFGSKERLYAEAVKFAHSCCTEGLAFPEWPEGTSPERKLRDFIRVMMGRMLEVPRPSAMQLMMREMTQPTPAGADAVRAYIQPLAQVLLGILTELLPDAEPRKLLMTGFSVIGQCLYYRQNRACGEALFGEDFLALDVDTLAEHISDFSLAAITASTPVASGRRMRKGK